MRKLKFTNNSIYGVTGQRYVGLMTGDVRLEASEQHTTQSFQDLALKNSCCCNHNGGGVYRRDAIDKFRMIDCCENRAIRRAFDPGSCNIRKSSHYHKLCSPPNIQHDTPMEVVLRQPHGGRLSHSMDFDGDVCKSIFHSSPGGLQISLSAKHLGCGHIINNTKTGEVFNMKNVTKFMNPQLRKMFGAGESLLYRFAIIDNFIRPLTAPIVDTAKEYIDNNFFCSLTVSGHYDSFISKSCSKVILKYLKRDYGEKILIEVDKNFALCSASLDKVRKSVLAYPEMVNLTIRPGVFTVELDTHGTKLIVVKSAILSEGDISYNGIKSDPMQFKTMMFFIGPKKVKWKEHIRKQIDERCSKLVTSASSSDKIRVNSMSGDEDGRGGASDIQVRPLPYLTFPAKDELLHTINRFKENGKIYKENGIPHRLGFLFSGNPGTGKTASAYSIAQQFEMECMTVNLNYFDKGSASNAFNGTNTIYIIDEIDSQLETREEKKKAESETQSAKTSRLIKLLKAMDEMGNGSIVIATTNYPDRLDSALLRSGRFDHKYDFSDLTEVWARKMVAARDLDPDYVLKGVTFPVNPASLEQVIVEKILEKNEIKLRHEIDVESLVNDSASSSTVVDTLDENNVEMQSMPSDDDRIDFDDEEDDLRIPSGVPGENGDISMSDDPDAVCMIDDDDDE